MSAITFDSFLDVEKAIKDLAALLEKGSDSNRLRRALVEELGSDKFAVWETTGEKLHLDATIEVARMLYEGVTPPPKYPVGGDFVTIGSILARKPGKYAVNPLAPDMPLVGDVDPEAGIDWSKQTKEIRSFVAWCIQENGGFPDSVNGKLVFRDLVLGNKVNMRWIRAIWPGTVERWEKAGKTAPTITGKTKVNVDNDDIVADIEL